MAKTYFLNGTVRSITVYVNGGSPLSMGPLDFEDPGDPTAKCGLAPVPSEDVIGLGDNQILVSIAGTETRYRVSLDPQVIKLALDVQFVVFENELQPRNTIGSQGFTIKKLPSDPTPEPPPFPDSRCQRNPPPVVRDGDGDIDFKLVGSDSKGALYGSSANGTAGNGAAYVFYYLFRGAGASLDDSLTLQQTWDDQGAYAFVDEELAPATLLAELSAALSRSGTSYSRLAWRHAANSYDIVQSSTASAVAVDQTFAVGNFTTLLRTGATLSLDAGAPGVRIQTAGGGGVNSIEIQIIRGGMPRRAGTLPQAALVPLDGTHRGALTLAWDWSHYQLGTDFGGNLRMFFGDDPGAARQAQYPLFTPAPDPGPRPKVDLYFDFYLQPMAAFDGERTRLALDLDQKNELTSNYLSSTTNAAVSLLPAAPVNGGLSAGFGFAKSPKGPYMCPVGEFEVGAPASGAGAERIQIRAGLSGTEYVLAEPGDRIRLHNGMPAFAPGYQPGASGPTTLDGALTTSWVQVLRQGNLGRVDAEQLVDTSYCAQSSASTYFGKNPSTGTPRYDYSIAVGASLVQFAKVPRQALFPLFPYGGVFYADDANGIPNPNPDLSARNLLAIEQDIVSPGRRTELEPLFNAQTGPLFFDTSTNLAFDGGYARTPLGLLAALNQSTASGPPAGTIARIIFARSPQNPDQYLQLTAGNTGVVNTQFSNNVLSDNLFLVVTDPRALQPFDNEIKLGDFTFDVTVGMGENQAIAVFKFIPGVTTRALIQDPDRWITLTGDDSIEKIAARLKYYVQIADQGGDLFASFVQLIDDPNWSGLLVFNCPLEYTALPLDIQILLGGLQHELIAHHFGVTINRVEESTNSGDMKLDQSSLFSVIHYEAQFETPSSFPNFQVLLLNVRYVNSALAVFDSQIAFSIQSLFGNQVALTVAPKQDFPDTGTIVIDGVYTLYEDGTGSLVFSTNEQRSFTAVANDGILRIVEAQSVTDASLVPIRRDQENGTIIAVSSFQLDSVLALSDGIGGDLFSYGKITDDVPVEGLALADYAFRMRTRIHGNDAQLESSIPTVFDSLKVDQVSSKARTLSLEQTFPSTITGLSYAPGGLRPLNLGEWQVRVGGESFKAAPVYSLTFDVPLGLLGALLSLRSNLVAQLYVGWAPGGSADKSDTVGLMLRLPAAIAGPRGFDFQGIISSSFDYVELDQITLSPSTGGEDKSVYALLFVHYQGYLLAFSLAFNTDPKDLGLFGGPGNPGGSNPLFFVGKSTDEPWNGPSLSVTLEDVPSFFLGRSFAIQTDPTNPNVIDDVLNELTNYTDKTVEEFLKFIYANSGKYNADAGIAFAIGFEYKSLSLKVVLHDSSFYGAQIKITPEQNGNGNGNGNGDGAPELPTQALQRRSHHSLAKSGNGEEKKGFLEQIEDFTFTIIYRKISDGLGVWSADIYLNLGTLNVGAFQLTLPNFSISIWTNGDWRFAVGWPFNGDDATPISVQFQAGPVPIIAKLGFYLGKLRSASAPNQFGDKFNLIWTFGIGLAGGVGKEWEQGPLKAGASLMLGLTVEGFLASYTGKMTENGVDYWWWGISLSLVGKAYGEVDFKIISADISLTLTLTLAFAIETAHSTPLKLTFNVEARASIKIVFVRISFSFSATLNLFSFTFGSGPVAQLDGPTPSAVLARGAGGLRGPAYARASMAARPGWSRPRTAAPVPIAVCFVLQPTSVSADGKTWAPTGVATLVMLNGDTGSPFGLLAAGLAEWLLGAFGGSGTFREQLDHTAAALRAGDFDSRVDECLAASFVFGVGSSSFTAEQDVVGLPVHPSLRLIYGETAAHDCAPDTGHASFGSRKVPGNFIEMVSAYFAGDDVPVAANVGETSVAERVFDEYFVMLAKQLIDNLQGTGADSLPDALKELDLGDLGGFVSRFLFGGIRLPDPDHPDELLPMYVLTDQQFALVKHDDAWVLDATLAATAGTPSWIQVQDDTKSSLSPSMVHTSGPSSPPWALGQLRALTERSLIFPMNNNVNWTDRSGAKLIISTFAENLHQAIVDWNTRAGSPPGPWLVLELIGGSSDDEQQVNLADGGVSWAAATALSLPIKLAGIPDPAGKPGSILPNVFSLLGTDEANRAALQALLQSDVASVQAVDLLIAKSRGNYVSTAVPSVLVRTNLSTDSAPAAAAGAAVRSAFQDESESCANYAKPGQGGDQLRRFLRLVWEVSVVHSDGFYLQVEGLDPELFKDGPADLTLLIRTGVQASTVETALYHNALVGLAPEGGKAVFATLASDAAGTPVIAHTAAYPGGEVGWNITWNNAPSEASADSADFLQGLYQMVSYRVEAVNGTPHVTSWSRPIPALDKSANDGARKRAQASAGTDWSYQNAFETASFVGSDNRYGAVNDTFTVRISIEDIFGNTLPSNALPTVTLSVLYNDDIVGLGDWAGTQSYYEVLVVDGQLVLQVSLALDASVVQDSKGKVDPQQLDRARLLYGQIRDQISDPNMGAAFGTGKVLAGNDLTQQSNGKSSLSGLVAYAKAVFAWLQAGGAGDPPRPTILDFALDRTYPVKWSGDLQELAVSLTLTRAGVADDIARLAPQVRAVSSPIQAVQGATSDKDPSGLTSFADGLERGYHGFDGGDGTIKVATGVNSDLRSQRFARQSIWLMRWSESAGATVKVQNDASTPPVFYAPPPLSTQLITRNVTGLRDYKTPDEYTDVIRNFSSVDMDRWAEAFLSTVESIFNPKMAPVVADRSSPGQELYDPFVDNKTSLACSISDSLDYVYDEPEGTGNPASARKTWRQALLRTLENDYGISTLVQLQALVGLHGDLEPGGDPRHPPRMFGAIEVPGEAGQAGLPYSLSPTRLPLVAGVNWLDVLVTARDPAAQRAFTLDLAYQMNQLEHQMDGASAACGYIPSSWLTFVLQQDPAELRGGGDNTLTAPIGTTRIPIPLRTYPPTPKLISASATQDTPAQDITEIQQALTWTYTLVVERSPADQDTLDLAVTFNEPVEKDGGSSAARAYTPRGRDLPENLFDALARFVYEYPQLAPYIDALDKGGADSVKALQELSDIVAGAAIRWKSWKPPAPSRASSSAVARDADEEVWNFAIQNVESSDNLEVKATWNRGDDAPPWPEVAGYTRISATGNTAIYQPQARPLLVLKMSWRSLYVLDYQSARASAFTQRNRNLAPEPQETNPAFTYRTETVTAPTPTVPLITVENAIALASGESLEAAVRAMLDALASIPPNAVRSNVNQVIRTGSSIDYKYQVMAHLDTSVSTMLPVFVLDREYPPRDPAALATEIARNLSTWRNVTNVRSNQSNLSFKLTLFATMIIAGTAQLPLVQFPGLDIPVPDDDPSWWTRG